MNRHLRLSIWLSIAFFAARCVLAVDLSTTNRDCLQQLWAATDQPQGPITVVSFGDSMADSYRSINYVLMNRLAARFGIAGYSLNNYQNALMVNFGGNRSILGPDRYWYNSYYSLSAGSFLWWENQANSGGLRCNRVGLFYIAYPGGGLFTLSVSTNGSPWSPLLSLNGEASIPTGVFTNLDLPLNYYRIRVDSQSKTNLILGAHMLNTTSNGIHAVFTDLGGLALNQITNVARSIREPIFAALDPKLLIWNMKEDGDLITHDCLVECEDWWAQAIPGCDVLYVGTPWCSLDTNSVTPGTPWLDLPPDSTITIQQNALVRWAALTYGRAYVDCMTPAVSYPWMLSKGYMADETHENLSGNTYLAGIAWDDLGFYALGRNRSLSLSLSNSVLSLRYPTSTGILYTVETSSTLAGWEPLFSAQGDGQIVNTNTSASDATRFFRLRLDASGD